MDVLVSKYPELQLLKQAEVFFKIWPGDKIVLKDLEKDSALVFNALRVMTINKTNIDAFGLKVPVVILDLIKDITARIEKMMRKERIRRLFA